MRIDISTFGTSLLSRPNGREAALALQANTLRTLADTELIELDFNHVVVLTPSWLDAFMQTLKEKYGDRIKILSYDNPTVKLSLETIGLSPA